jgi:hypothetical protein
MILIGAKGQHPAHGALGEFHDSPVTVTDPRSASPARVRRISVREGLKTLKMNEFISEMELMRLTAS